MQRLQKDIKELQTNPLPGANAVPEENDISLWHGNIMVPLTIDGKVKSTPIHFMIEIPEDYPKSAPNVGFLHSFPYNMGAYMNISKGRLKDLFTLCLNILGNFSFVHTEWKNQVGEGWSPSMTISTVLIQLQSILSVLDTENKMSSEEKKKLFQQLKDAKCSKCNHTGTAPYPQLLTFEEIQAEKAQKQQKEYIENKIPAQVKEKVLAFIQNAKLDVKFQEQFIEIIQLIQAQASNNGNNSQQQQNNSNKTEEEKKKDETSVQGQQVKEEVENTAITNNIVCYISGESFKTQTLGYGIYLDKNLLSTPAELLSWVEFSQNNIKQSSNKTSFTHYLPAFICPKHSILNPKWVNLSKECISKLGDLITASQSEEIIIVLPKIINSMIVEMKKSSKAQALLYFEALCNIWRTLYWYVSTNEQLQKKVVEKIKLFTQSEQERHKDRVPDLGVFLAMYTAISDKVKYEDFVDALLDENFIRCVMWWRDSVQSESPEDVFQATEVSREILLFQMTLVRELIGEKPAATAIEMDKTYCTMPGILDKFQARIKNSKIANWKQYFQEIGASQSFQQKTTTNLGQWIQDCITRSESKGPKYQKKSGGNRGGYRGGRGGRGGGRGRGNYY